MWSPGVVPPQNRIVHAVLRINRPWRTVVANCVPPSRRKLRPSAVRRRCMTRLDALARSRRPVASRRPAGVRMRRVARQSAGLTVEVGARHVEAEVAAWLRGVGRIVAPLSARAPRGSRIDKRLTDAPTGSARVCGSQRRWPWPHGRPARTRCAGSRLLRGRRAVAASASVDVVGVSSPASRSSPLPPVTDSKPGAMSLSPGSPTGSFVARSTTIRACGAYDSVSRPGPPSSMSAFGPESAAAPSRSPSVSVSPPSRLSGRRSRRRRPGRRRSGCPSARRRRTAEGIDAADDVRAGPGRDGAVVHVA